jgi:hypothetical protein
LVITCVGELLLCVGGRGFLRERLWGYCFEHFEESRLWIVDSLPIFDPYWASRRDVARTRELLASIRIARPFTIHQLLAKLYSLTKLPLADATVVVSCMDCFDEEVKNMHNRRTIQLRMAGVLRGLPCKCIIGFKSRNEVFGGGAAWAEQCSQ